MGKVSRVIPEISEPSCREIIYGAYRVMYRLVNNDVWITCMVQEIGLRNNRSDCLCGTICFHYSCLMKYQYVVYKKQFL